MSFKMNIAVEAGGAPLRVGVVGAGFVAKNFIDLARKNLNFVEIVKVFSRRPADASPWIGEDVHTSSLEALADAVDVVLEVSGDVGLATQTCLLMAERGLPVVTLNSEFHVTNGSYFVDRMFLTEAHGDQPGNAAALHTDAKLMGFEPLAHINYKGFLNHNPSREDMLYWAEKQGLSLASTVSFTDGSKLQIEQAFTANGLGLDIACEGLIGGMRADGLDLDAYGDAAMALGRPIADFAQAKGAPPGVAIVASHEFAGKMMDYIAFTKIGTASGRYLVLQTGFHLVHLEIPRIFEYLWRTPMDQWRPLLDNSATPQLSAAAVAKRPLRRGETIAEGLGAFDVRGVAVRIAERPDHVPICLLRNARVVRDVAPGDMVTFDDIDLDDTVELRIYRALRQSLPRATPRALETV